MDMKLAKCQKWILGTGNWELGNFVTKASLSLLGCHPKYS